MQKGTATVPAFWFVASANGTTLSRSGGFPCRHQLRGALVAPTSSLPLQSSIASHVTANKLQRPSPPCRVSSISPLSSNSRFALFSVSFERQPFFFMASQPMDISPLLPPLNCIARSTNNRVAGNDRVLQTSESRHTSYRNITNGAPVRRPLALRRLSISRHSVVSLSFHRGRCPALMCVLHCARRPPPFVSRHSEAVTAG